MRKIFILTKREFLTAVRTKSFLIGLIIAPLLMGGSFIVIKLFEDKIDVDDKKIAIIDHSGIMAESLIEISSERNKEIFDKETGEKINPAYYSENSLMDNIRDWVSQIINKRVRKLRVVDLNIDNEVSKG